jgi:hypothetical protein
MTILHNTLECPTHSGLEVEVPRQSSWHTPKGSYHSTIRSVNIINRFGFGSKLARLVFDVHVANSQLDYLAKLDLKLDLSEGSDLWNLICRLFSRKALQDNSGSTFDLERLVGMECDVEIDHNCDKAEEYDFPLVLVTDVREAGRLVKPSVQTGNLKDRAVSI